MLSVIFEGFDELPIILKFLVFFFAVVPIMVSIQIFIMPVSILICILDFVMNLACRNCNSLEADFLPIVAFFLYF